MIEHSDVDFSNPASVLAESERRNRLRAQGAMTFRHDAGCTHSEVIAGQPQLPLGDERIIDESEIGSLEKAIEQRCDKIVLALNGRIIKFSHPGKTKQTPGISDRIYAFPRRQLISWWELKTPENQQSSAQIDFEQVVTACGHESHAGGLGDFKAWLVARGVVAGFGENDTPIPAPLPPIEAP